MDAISRNVWLPKTEGSRKVVCTSRGGSPACAAQNSTDSALASWIGEIRKACAKGAASTHELARLVSTARDQLPRGAWNSLWKKPLAMPFSRRYSYQLIAVGRGLGWANVHVRAHLPGNLRVLCQLAKLDRAAVESAIEQGLLHPALKESDARALVARFRGDLASVASRPFNLRQRLKRFAAFVRESLDDWQPQERALARRDLSRLIEEIDAAGQLAGESTGLRMSR